MNIHNLFSYCIDNIHDKNVKYYIYDPYEGISVDIIAINSDNKILKYTNEWLSLISGYYKTMYTFTCHKKVYESIVKNYIKTVNNSTHITINENVIPLCTTFSKGTVHGYGGLFYILNEYLINKSKYENCKLLVYKKSQSGILDIIDHLVKNNIITSDKIIFINEHIYYKFDQMTIIPNLNHNMDLQIVKSVINTYLKQDLTLKICIIKSTASQVNTLMGVLKDNIVELFCKKNNYIRVEPSVISEIELINLLNNCTKFITTWGTAYFKNMAYISDKCKEIDVFVTPDFMHQYNDVHFRIVPPNMKVNFIPIDWNMIPI